MNIFRRFRDRRLPVLDPTDWTINHDPWDGDNYTARGDVTDPSIKFHGRYRIDFGGTLVVVRIVGMDFMKWGPYTWTACM